MSTVFARPDVLRSDNSKKKDFEAVWVMAAKAGYALAFEELVNRNESRIYGLALNIMQNQKAAEHLLQCTFIKAHERLHECKDAARFSMWLMQICIREALQYCEETDLSEIDRDESTESEDDLMLNEVANWGDCPEQQYTKTELNRLLSEAISGLSLMHRIVFLLRDVETASIVEIAHLLGLSVSETRSRLLRARLRVRGYLNRFFSQEVCADSQFAGSGEERREEDCRTMAKTAVA